MTSIEERLRAATLAAAGTVPDGEVAPLRLPRSRIRLAISRLRGRTLYVVAPLTAAISVAGIFAAAAAARGSLGTSSPGTSAGGPSLHLLPADYVALTYVGTYKSWKIVRTRAVVASTTSGRRLAVVSPPKPYDTFTAITGTPDGLTYVLAAQDQTRSNVRHGQAGGPVKLYELKISSGTATLTPLLTPTLPAMAVGDMAISPDGSQLAVTGYWSDFRDVGLRVYDLATGALLHSWPVTGPPHTGKCCTFSPTATAPSWEANGQYVTIDVTLAHCQDCVALVNTQAPGTSVQAVSRVIARTHNRHYQEFWTNTIVSPDGNRLLRSAQVAVKTSRRSYYLVPRIFTYSVPSGMTLATLRGSRLHEWQVDWSSQSGRAFVVTAISQGDPVESDFISASLYQRGHWSHVPVPAQTRIIAW
jgi:hypothetical protein